MAAPENKLSLKLLVDSKRNKVLFAEAGSDFVDVLFSFLTLPLGTIIRVLTDHFGENTRALGCLNNLYSSLGNLCYSFFWKKEDKLMLLHPRNALEMECQLHKLKLKVDASPPSKYYQSFHRCQDISISQGVKCSHNHVMNDLIGLFTTDNEEVFTSSKILFIVTDDLSVLPSFDDLNFELLKELVSGAEELREVSVDVGFNEIMHLLKWSLLSKTPLTNLLNWKLSNTLEPEVLVPNLQPIVRTENYGTTIIKALVQKSTNKLLFFLGGGDFVEFLFRLLSIPLGSTVSLLGGNSGLARIDDLHLSITKLSSACLTQVSIKETLISPKVALCDIRTDKVEFRSFRDKPYYPGLRIMNLMGEKPSTEEILSRKQLIKGLPTFMITDDLMVMLEYCL